MNVSFAGMQIHYGHFRSKGFLLDVVYHGRSVFKSGSFLGFPAPIDTCIAKMAGYPEGSVGEMGKGWRSTV